jgi:hypothetical protein
MFAPLRVSDICTFIQERSPLLRNDSSFFLDGLISSA